MNAFEQEIATRAAGRAPRPLAWPALTDPDLLAAPTRVSVAATPRGAGVAAWLRRGADEDAAYLVPLRLFIGLGWLRAGAEKVLDPGWWDGASLAGFLDHHVSTGQVAFPWYETLIAQIFLPYAAPLALVILLGQLLAGVAIAAGALTNAALLGGIVMNLNFLLVGDPNPSVFYLVIQAVLLLTNAGAVLGLDAVLSRRIDNPLLAAQATAGCRLRVPALAIGALALVAAVYALAHVRDWSPAGSVHDPAMVFAIVAMMTLAWTAIAKLRQDAGRRSMASQRAARAPAWRIPDRRGVARDPRHLRSGAPVDNAPRAAAGAGRGDHSPRRPRRLSLTFTLAWPDAGDAGDGGERGAGDRRAPAAS